MQLQPRRQPGRTDRKAAAYASEILQLRTEGYTYEAIREALADVGIELSTSALRREIRRRQHQARPRAVWARDRAGRPSSAVPAAATADSPAVLAAVQRPRIAEAFFIAHPSNPLLRTKEVP